MACSVIEASELEKAFINEKNDFSSILVGQGSKNISFITHSLRI